MGRLIAGCFMLLIFVATILMYAFGAMPSQQPQDPDSDAVPTYVIQAPPHYTVTPQAQLVSHK